MLGGFFWMGKVSFRSLSARKYVIILVSVSVTELGGIIKSSQLAFI